MCNKGQLINLSRSGIPRPPQPFEIRQFRYLSGRINSNIALEIFYKNPHWSRLQ